MPSLSTYHSCVPVGVAWLQVFASIQTLVLVKDPYYNEGEGRSSFQVAALLMSPAVKPP